VTDYTGVSEKDYGWHVGVEPRLQVRKFEQNKKAEQN